MLHSRICIYYNSWEATGHGDVEQKIHLKCIERGINIEVILNIKYQDHATRKLLTAEYLKIVNF